MTTETTGTAFADWVILELLGHRRLAGYLTEAQIAGESFLRLDIPGEPCPTCNARGNLDQYAPNGEQTHLGSCPDCRGLGNHIRATQYYAAGAVYAITPTSRDTATRVADISRAAPIQHWELPAAQPSDAWMGDTEDAEVL